jgi:hypothetical protein
MFSHSEFDNDISEWDVSKVESMQFMFYKAKFNKDISKWDVKSILYFTQIFDDCPIKEEYKPKFKN